MSWLQPGDTDLHHSDWGHRHTGGPGTDEGDERFRQRMAAHMELHRKGLEPSVRQGVHRFEDFPA